MDFYNAKRPHGKLQYKAPEQKELEYTVTNGLLQINSSTWEFEKVCLLF